MQTEWRSKYIVFSVHIYYYGQMVTLTSSHCYYDNYLYQNNLSRISGLTNSPELTEFWVQGNSVSSLDGFENNSQLKDLGESFIKMEIASY